MIAYSSLGLRAEKDIAASTFVQYIYTSEVVLNLQFVRNIMLYIYIYIYIYIYPHYSTPFYMCKL